MNVNLYFIRSILLDINIRALHNFDIFGIKLSINKKIQQFQSQK